MMNSIYIGYWYYSNCDVHTLVFQFNQIEMTLNELHMKKTATLILVFLCYMKARNSFQILFLTHLYYLISVFLIDLASKLSNCFTNFTLRRCNQLSQCISSRWCFDFNVSVRFFFFLFFIITLWESNWLCKSLWLCGSQ